MASVSRDNTINNGDDKFDPLMESYDHDFVEFMSCWLREGGVLDSNHEGTANLDAFSGSPGLSLQQVDDDAEHRHDDDGDSCGVLATKTRRKDRSKTLVSERKRRVRMKEKLYELRSIVPIITKMDKASIIADAIVYVKDLQSQAKKLEEEISMLESSPIDDEMLQVSHKNTTKFFKGSNVTTGKVMQVGVHEVGEGRFYVKVEGSEGDGAAAPSSLYSAIESLPCFDLQSSNFSLSSEGLFVITMTLKVGDFSKVMDASTMKLWVMAALLNEGFQLMQRTAV